MGHEKQTLQKDLDKLDELQVENQNLKSDKDYVERHIEDEFKKLQVENQNLREQLQLNSNPIVPLKKIKKSDVQNLENPEEEPVGFTSEEIDFSDFEVSSNCSNSEANQVTFKELTIPDCNNDNPEENKNKVKKYHQSTKSDSNIIN